MKTELAKIKEGHLHQLADYKKQLQKKPILKFLFLELTSRCNEHCLHCGSSCDYTGGFELSLEQYKKILTDIAADFDVNSFQLCITGGEPLLRTDFFDILGFAKDLGYHWGMTSNGTLIDAGCARKLHECGMGTISVSIDGLKETHDRFRRTPGGYDAAMRGINCLLEEGGFRHVQVTTVINHTNMHELEPLYDIFCGIDIDSWRIIGIEPIGRALTHPEMMLTGEDYRYLFDFIREKRSEGMPLTYGCSHFLGLDYEREVRKHYFICNAGIYVAAITSTGDITSCLDIERRPETVFGNILTDRLKDVWENGFQIFRGGLAEKSEKCRTCSQLEFCAGGACHSWDYDKNEQRMCFKDVLF